MTGEPVRAYTINNDMNKAGFTSIAAAIALRALGQQGMVTSQSLQDNQTGEYYNAFDATVKGKDWLMANQHLLKLQREPVPF